MRALEITGDNLEDFLTYDDVFLDYFNAFLALPVFPLQLAYNRLMGAFEEIEEQSDRTSSLAHKPQPYGATEEEREKMLEWASTERLPLFIRSHLFRELKFCKHLLRPLDDRCSDTRASSQQIRGYSRQTESFVSSLSNFAEATDILEEPEVMVKPETHYSAPNKPTWINRMAAFSGKNEKVSSSQCVMGSQQDISFMKITKENSSSKASRKCQRFFDSEETIPLELTSSSRLRSAKLSVRPESQKKYHEVTFSRENTMLSYAAEPGNTENKSSSKENITLKSSTNATFQHFSRAISAPVNHCDYMRIAWFSHLDMFFGPNEDGFNQNGQLYVTFNDGVSEEQTDTDVRNMEGRIKLTLQQFKEQALGTYAGMEKFKEFLLDTAGIHIFNFWIDCENFKDAVSDLDDTVFPKVTNTLFRDIQDKYKMSLTKDARDQLTRAASSVGLSHTIFLRTQYDALRRLRAYWVPRFLLYLERMKAQNSSVTPQCKVIKWLTGQEQSGSLTFPTVSVSSTIQTRSNDFLSSHVTFDSNIVGNMKTKFLSSSHSSKSESTFSLPLEVRNTKNRFLTALTADRSSGGAFQRYLQKNGDKALLSSLLFWQDVTNYGAFEDQSADQMLQLCRAWFIYNQYISEGSPFQVDLSDKEASKLQKSLHSTKNSIEAAIFNAARFEVVKKLKKPWIRFLQEDIKMFLDCRVRRGEGDSPPSTAGVIEVTVNDGNLIINRPKPWVKRKPAPDEILNDEKLVKYENIDEQTKAEQKRLAMVHRKMMERERRKAMRAARQRQLEARRKAAMRESNSGLELAEIGEELEAANLPTFRETMENKQLTCMFKKYLQEVQNGQEVLNIVNLYMDADAYQRLGHDPAGTVKKNVQANYILKTYLDQHARKHVPLKDKLQSDDMLRPTTPVLNKIKDQIVVKIEDAFHSFLSVQADEVGVNMQDFAGMSQVELTSMIQVSKEEPLPGPWTNRRRKGKTQKVVSSAIDSVDIPLTMSPAIHRNNLKIEVESEIKEYYAQQSQMLNNQFTRTISRALPMRDDKIDFLLALNQSAMGHLSLKMLFFYNYLIKHGEEEGLPFLDRDLFFYVEVQKFKDYSHAYSDEVLLKKKVQSIVDCFLESVTCPSLQVDIPAEIHQRSLKAAQRYVTGKEVTPSIFDDAQMTVFRELLPFWAGFHKSHKFPENAKKRPATKYQKLLKKRLEAIESYKIPPKNINLPTIPAGPVGAFTFTLNDGIKWRFVDGSWFCGIPSSALLAGKKSVDIRSGKFHAIHPVLITRTAQ